MKMEVLTRHQSSEAQIKYRKSALEVYKSKELMAIESPISRGPADEAPRLESAPNRHLRVNVPNIPGRALESAPGAFNSPTFGERMHTTPFDSFSALNPLQYETASDNLTGQVQEPAFQFSPASLPVGAEATGFPRMQSSFDPDLWNPSILSTINWLGMDTGPVDTNGHLATFQNPAYRYSVGVPQAQLLHQTSVPRMAQTSNPLPQSQGHAATDYSRSHSDEHSVDSAVTIESSFDSINVNNDQAEPGEFYVDGEPARLPRVNQKVRHKFNLTMQDYEAMKNCFQETCVTQTAGVPTFYPIEFPPVPFIENLVGLYVDSFQSLFPMLHLPSLVSPKTHWLLLLAMAAIGSHSLELEGSEIFIESMHEFVQRAIVPHETEQSTRPPVDDLTYIQVRLLHLIGVVYGAEDNTQSSTGRIRQTISELYASKIFHIDSQNLATRRDSHSLLLEADWVTWRDEQARCRTAYCIWLLDTMSSFHFQLRPSLRLEDTDWPLPCHERLWNAPSAEEWNRLRTHVPAPPNLLQALQNIYIDKKLSPTLGEFSRILLIHGIFRRTWEVEAYVSQPLSQWEPTAQKQSSSELLPQSTVWPPSIPLFTRWRNSACDCLDILHWSANAAIGSASGIEHPTVMHLHLARVVLLTPYSSIVALAKAIGSTQAPSHISGHRDKILKWTTRDQYKARLAMIHAGVLFWHIRRYSANGFYEPSSVALATLALWAFSAFSPVHHTKSNSAQLDAPATDGDGNSKCNIILLDRPTDDELVQDFVRRGQNMHAHVTGVGDLYGDGAPVRVLEEGRKLLGTLGGWGLKEDWTQMLKRLEDVGR
ncbi:MAG: hypothetical protein Q9160_002837 [Pyrenula sp. 1 TL-2023]